MFQGEIKKVEKIEYFLWNTYKKQLIFQEKYAILHKRIVNRPYGQAVKTTPSHGVNSGSSPDKVTKKKKQPKWLFFFLLIFSRLGEREGFVRGDL